MTKEEKQDLVDVACHLAVELLVNNKRQDLKPMEFHVMAEVVARAVVPMAKIITEEVDKT